MKRIRVLIVDDSSAVRTMLTRLLGTDPRIEVVGSAPDPYVARDKLLELTPDVMTLDIEMPKMDGITFLSKVMKYYPTRTVVVSSLSTQGSAAALRALEAGAIDVIGKPGIDVTKGLNEMAQELVERVVAAAHARLLPASPLAAPVAARPVAVPSSVTALPRTSHQILAIAASTGGTVALRKLLSALPADIPGTVIVQHMPPVFTRTFADHLSSICKFAVREAVDGEKILPGTVLIAPGNFHMEIARQGGYYHVRLHQEPLLHGVRPAADYLMKSVAKHAAANAIGVVLTGMGKDGADGLREMKDAGSCNFAQSEETCVVFGMPKVAIERGGIDEVLPLEEIAGAIVKRLRAKAAA